MFARPWLLLLLALPVLHVYWVWTRRGGRVAMPFDSDGRRRLGSGGLMRRCWRSANPCPDYCSRWPSCSSRCRRSWLLRGRSGP